MTTDLQSIKYTKVITSVTHYDTGLCDWSDIEMAYRNQSLRGKVVCRFDAAYFLNAYFSDEIILKYRPALLMLAKALVMDSEQFSDVIKDLLKMDKVFANKIHDIFHSCPEERSFGWHIIQTLADVFINVESRYRTFFRNRSEVVICVSDGYLYYSFDDIGIGPLLPDRVDCEVLSNVKNWNGNYRYR